MFTNRVFVATTFACSLGLGGCGLFQPTPPASPPPSLYEPAPISESVPSAHHSQVMGHDAMAHVQQALQDKGYYWGKVDGLNGPKTIAAVKEYQRDLGVPATGVVGHKEWSSLGLDN